MAKYFIVVLIVLSFTLTLTAQPDRGLKRVTVRLPDSGKQVELYGRSRAVVVGVSEYASWPDLPNAVRDAREVAQALRGLGFEVNEVQNPGSEALEEVLKDLEFSKGVSEDRLVFYFAGHGETEQLANDEELGYIVPADAPLKSVDPRGFVEKAIGMDRLEQCAKRLRFKHALFVFDSCFSGSIFTLQRAAPQNITEKSGRPVRQFITAGGKDETVPDVSVFKTCFLRALSGEGDLTGDGYVTGTELGIYLNEQVVNYSKGSQHPQAGKLRDPKLDRGDFVFVTAKPLPEPQIPPPPPAPVAFGHLQVNVNAPDSRVYVGGVFRGDASPGKPLNLTSVALGEVEVRVEAGGYETQTKGFALASNAWTQAVFELPVVEPPTPSQPTPPVSSSRLAEPGMVFIPAGEFEMGSGEGGFVIGSDELGNDEKPVHTVSVGGFYLDKYEVTVAEFRKFKADYGPNKYSACDNCPATDMTWADARAYCESLGKRLPTEAEWEKACRGPEGNEYSWGNAMDQTKGRFGLKLEEGAAPVGSHASNGYGVYDMSGNVGEWVSSKYSEYPYRAKDGREDIDGSEDNRMVRGGSSHFSWYNVRCAYRHLWPPYLWNSDLGFRCAR